MDIQERHPRNCQDAVPKALKERLHSREKLIHFGFSTEKADKVWQRWTNWSSGDLEPHREGDPDHGGLEMTFLDFFTGFITSQNDTWSSEDAEWVRCMNSYGISKELQDAILDPMNPNASPLSMDNAASAQAQAFATQSAPDRIVLYKATDKARIRRFMDDAGQFQNLNALASSLRSDFSPNTGFIYFTADLTVAQYHAAYAKRRGNASQIVIICLSIPHAALESLISPAKLTLSWRDDEWRQMVWNCRTGRILGHHLEKFHGATLIIGTIARLPNLAYEQMQSWKQLNESCVFKRGPQNNLEGAIQYAFSGLKNGERFLEEHGVFRMFEFIDEEYQIWRAENDALWRLYG